MSILNFLNICTKLKPKNPTNLSALKLLATHRLKTSKLQLQFPKIYYFPTQKNQFSVRAQILFSFPKKKPNNPGRPIFSACSCPTEIISSYSDKIIATIVKTLPFYIKDSRHAQLKFFVTLVSSAKQSYFFVFMYIISLYTVIPNDEGLRALQRFFDHRTVKEPSSE